MLSNCRKSCGTCFKGDDLREKNIGDPKYRGSDFGVAQQLVFEDGTREEDIHWIIVKTQNYMNQVVPKKFGRDTDKLCRNKSDHCAWWALLGMYRRATCYLEFISITVNMREYRLS